MQATKPQPKPRTLRDTVGVCHTCLQQVPAEVLRQGEEVILKKSCAQHGFSQETLSSCGDYWEELDRFYFKVNQENYPQRDYIVRMTEVCNLDCPICLAKANTEETADLDLKGLEDLPPRSSWRAEVVLGRVLPTPAQLERRSEDVLTTAPSPSKAPRWTPWRELLKRSFGIPRDSWRFAPEFSGSEVGWRAAGA